MYVRFGHVRECRGVMLRNVAICVLVIVQIAMCACI